MAEDGWAIRASRAGDAGAIAEMWQALAEQHRGYHASRWDWADGAAGHMRARAAECCDRDDIIQLVAVDGSALPVGFARGAVREAIPALRAERQGHVWDLFVRPAWRRRGIGTALLGSLVEELRLAGAEDVHLRVAAAGGPAVAFYRRRGFDLVAHEMYRRL